MKKLLVAAALAMTIAGTSCIGTNTAFNNLHAWNEKVTDSKWGNEAIFLGLNIIPIYPIWYLGDIFIFNSIEFWGGNNPLK